MASSPYKGGVSGGPEMKKTLTIIAKTVFLVALSPIIILGMAGGLTTKIAEAMLDTIDEARATVKGAYLG